MKNPIAHINYSYPIRSVHGLNALPALRFRLRFHRRRQGSSAWRRLSEVVRHCCEPLTPAPDLRRPCSLSDQILLLQKTLITKNYLYSAAIGGVIALLSPIAQAADGTINFSGSISASTCTVAVLPPAVKLQNVDVGAVKNKGEPAGAMPFTITLSGCGQDGKVATKFEPIKVNHDTGNLVPDSGTGQATNVEIGLYNNDLAKKIDLSKSDAVGQKSAQGDIKKGQDTTLHYLAAYLGNGQLATAGTVSASTMFTMDYQ